MVIKKNGDVVRLPSKCTVQIEKGDALIVHTPGGGGYGNPKKREKESVLRDVLNGFVSSEVAERDYGVIIDLKNMKIDEERTFLLRS